MTLADGLLIVAIILLTIGITLFLFAIWIGIVLLSR